MLLFVRKISILLIGTIALVFGQSTVKVHGIVLDAENGQPVVNAMIFTDGTAIGTATDINGRFTLEQFLVGEYVLQVRCLGYVPQTQSVRVDHDHGTGLTIRLRPTLLRTSDVVVRAGRLPQEPYTGNVFISREQIRQSNASDVGELLRAVSGLEVRESGASGSSKTVSVRGGQSNQMLVLINGIRLGNPITGEIDLSTIPLAAIEGVEIRKGAQSAISGEGALVGVIDISTRKPSSPALSFASHLASFAGSGVSISCSEQWSSFISTLSFERMRSIGDFPYRYRHGEQIIADRRRNAGASQEQLFLQMDGDIAGGICSMMFQSLMSKRGLPGQVYAWTPWAKSELQRNLLQMTYSWRHWHVKAAYHQEWSQYRNTYGDVPLRYRTVPPYWNENNLKHATVTVDWDRTTVWQGRLLLGGEGSYTGFADRNRLEAGAQSIGQTQTSAGAFYAQAQTPLCLPGAFRLNFRTGGRLDLAFLRHRYNSRREMHFNPFITLSLNKTIFFDWQLHTSWSRGFRLPTYADLYYQQYRVQGNADLLPEKNTSREMGATVSWRQYGEGSLRATFFRNQVNDLIIWRMGSFATFTPTNTDAILSGAEYEGQWLLAKRVLQLSASHTILTTKNLSPDRTVRGKYLPYRPKHSSKLSLRAEFGLIDAEYSLRSVGDRFVTEANTVILPGYTVNDLSLSVTFHVANLDQSIKLSVYNLSDRRYQIIENAPLPGREWRLSWQLMGVFKNEDKIK